jgi:hypothetical protein
MNIHPKGVRVWCTFFLGGALIGASVYSATFEYVQYTNAKRALAAEQALLSKSGLMRYGIVVATDPAYQTITISFPDKFYNDQKRINGTYLLSPGAPITRQTLISNGTAYTALSEPQQISFSDIQIGENIAVYAPLNADGSLTAASVTVGDPL